MQGVVAIAAVATAASCVLAGPFTRKECGTEEIVSVSGREFLGPAWKISQQEICQLTVGFVCFSIASLIGAALMQRTRRVMQIAAGVTVRFLSLYPPPSNTCSIILAAAVSLSACISLIHLS